jgi:E3 ubiquitin-protein ligase UBR4
VNVHRNVHQSQHRLSAANNAGDILFEWCTTLLPTLFRYNLKYEESVHQGKTLYLPTIYSEAVIIRNTLPQIESDISNLLLALALPILEPLTPSKIFKLSQSAMGALYCGILASIGISVLNMASSSSQKSSQSAPQQATSSGASSTTAASKDVEEINYEDFARKIVDKSLEIFTKVGNVLKTSTRAHIYQNHLHMGAWLSISGIQGMMQSGSSSSGGSNGNSTKQQTATALGEDLTKGKSPSKTLESQQQQRQTQTARVNLFKVQQGFGILNAAIARHCLTLN